MPIGRALRASRAGNALTPGNVVRGNAQGRRMIVCLSRRSVKRYVADDNAAGRPLPELALRAGPVIQQVSSTMTAPLRGISAREGARTQSLWAHRSGRMAYLPLWQPSETPFWALLMAAYGTGAGSRTDGTVEKSLHPSPKRVVPAQTVGYRLAKKHGSLSWTVQRLPGLTRSSARASRVISAATTCLP